MTKLTNKVISLFDRKTSMRLASSEWTAVDDICKKEQIKRKQLLEIIASNKDPKIGLTCSVRLFTIIYMHNFLKEHHSYTVVNAKSADNKHKKIYQTIECMS